MKARIESGKIVFYNAIAVIANVEGKVLKRIIRTKISVLKIENESKMLVMRWTIYSN